MSATIPTSSRPITLDELPPVLTAKLAALRINNPAMYTEITQRDPITNKEIL